MCSEVPSSADRMLRPFELREKRSAVCRTWCDSTTDYDAFVSRAVLHRVPLSAISRLLGIRRPSTTLRYVHAGDREIKIATQRIDIAIKRTSKERVRPKRLS